jgi:hypothetical protein
MKLELVVPTKLSEIPLKNYQKFLGIAKNTNDEVFLAEKMIQCFCGIELKDVVKIPFKEVEALSVHFGEMFQQKTQFKNRFTIAGVEFGFIPNLENMSWGEYIDLEANISDLSTFHKAMAVMYRPIIEKHGDKYKIEPYVSSVNYSDIMENVGLDIALSAKVFFYNLENELLQATLHYLETEIAKNKGLETTLAKELNLQSNGVGIKAYMQQLRETSRNLTPLPNYDLQLHLPTLLLKNKKTKLSNVN